MILFAGDPRQVPPVVPKESASDVVAASIVFSHFSPQVHIVRLEINMRVQVLADRGGDVEEQLSFARYLTEVGDGVAPTFTSRAGLTEQVALPSECCLPMSDDFAADVKTLIDAIYPQLETRFDDPAFEQMMIDATLVRAHQHAVAKKEAQPSHTRAAA